VPPLDPRQLRSHQRGTVLKILRTMPSPELELPQMVSHGVHVLPPHIVRGVITRGGVSEGSIESAFNSKTVGGTNLVPAHGLREQGVRVNRGVKGGRIVPREEASLQPGDRIAKVEADEVWLTFEMFLQEQLVEPPVIQGTKLRGQAAEVSDE